MGEKYTIVTTDGFLVRVELEPDQDSGPPWEDCDCYGIVDTGRRDKAAGEAVSYTHLDVYKRQDPRGMTYTPTELGRSDEFKTQFGYTLSACKTNRFLAAYGLQSNQTGAWIPTESAKGHYEWLDTGKRHTDGTPVKQLKWFKSVLTKMTAFHHQEAA